MATVLQDRPTQTTGKSNNVGRVSQVIGAVVDVHFDDQLPAILSALEDRKSTRLNSSHSGESRMPSSA